MLRKICRLAKGRYRRPVPPDLGHVWFLRTSKLEEGGTFRFSKHQCWRGEEARLVSHDIKGGGRGHVWFLRTSKLEGGGTSGFSGHQSWVKGARLVSQDIKVGGRGHVWFLKTSKLGEEGEEACLVSQDIHVGGRGHVWFLRTLKLEGGGTSGFLEHQSWREGARLLSQDNEEKKLNRSGNNFHSSFKH